MNKWSRIFIFVLRKNKKRKQNDIDDDDDGEQTVNQPSFVNIECFRERIKRTKKKRSK